MKTKRNNYPFYFIFSAVLSLLFILGCTHSDNDTIVYDITLAVNESYDINLGQHDVDEEEFYISAIPANATRSTRYLNPENGDEHYIYVPDFNFVGTDYVKIDKAYPNLLTQSGIVTENYIEINFTITDSR